MSGPGGAPNRRRAKNVNPLAKQAARMRKVKRQSPSAQSPSDIPPELDIDQAFQRLLQIIEDPHIARDRLYWGLVRGLVPLIVQDFARANEPFNLAPENFSDYYDIGLRKERDSWHACLRFRKGQFGGYEPSEYHWTVPTKAIDELCKEAKSASPAGAKRGRKPYEWDLFFGQCIVRLDTDAIGPNDNVSISDLAKKLMEWGGAHVGDKNTPDQAAMRDKVSSWVRTFQRMKELETEAKRKASRKTTSNKTPSK
jgi:hypothetical protein